MSNDIAYNQIIIDLIKKYMKQTNCSQAKLAAKAFMDRTTLNKFLNSVPHRIDICQVQRLINVLGVSTKEFWLDYTESIEKLEVETISNKNNESEIVSLEQNENVERNPQMNKSSIFPDLDISEHTEYVFTLYNLKFFNYSDDETDKFCETVSVNMYFSEYTDENDTVIERQCWIGLADYSTRFEIENYGILDETFSIFIECCISEYLEHEFYEERLIDTMGTYYDYYIKDISEKNKKLINKLGIKITI